MYAPEIAIFNAAYYDSRKPDAYTAIIVLRVIAQY